MADKKLSEFDNMSFTREHNVYIPAISQEGQTLENRKIPLSQFASNQDVNDEINAKLVPVSSLPENPDSNTFYFIVGNPEEL